MYQCHMEEKSIRLDTLKVGVIPGKGGNLGLDIDTDLVFKAETLPELFQAIAEFFGMDLTDIEAINGDNSICISRMETDAGEKATKGDIERFKHKKQRLWITSYWGEVTRVENVSEAEIQAALNITIKKSNLKCARLQTAPHETEQTNSI